MTLDSYVDGSIEFITSSIFKLHIRFVCLGSQMNSEVPFDDLRVNCVFWFMLTLRSQKIFTFMREVLVSEDHFAFGKG